MDLSKNRMKFNNSEWKTVCYWVYKENTIVILTTFSGSKLGKYKKGHIV